METIFMNRENSKTNESYKFVLNLSQRLDLRSSDKLVALQNLSIQYTWKNIRKQYNNNKLKIMEFELPDGSYSVSDMVLILFQIFKKMLNLSLKKMKH